MVGRIRIGVIFPSQSNEREGTLGIVWEDRCVLAVHAMMTSGRLDDLPRETDLFADVWLELQGEVRPPPPKAYRVITQIQNGIYEMVGRVLEVHGPHLLVNSEFPVHVDLLNEQAFRPDDLVQLTGRMRIDLDPDERAPRVPWGTPRRQA